MKSFNSVIFLSILFILLFNNPVFGSDWVQYGMSSDGNLYSYDKNDVKYSNNDIVQVWERFDFSDEGKDRQIKTLLDEKDSIKGWEKLSYSVSFSEINCKERKTQLLSLTLYDRNNGILQSYLSDTPDWKEILSDTPGDTLRELLCPQ